MNTDYCSYLDIETTGLNPCSENLTVIGLYLENGKENRFIQLVGNEISSLKLSETMEDVKVVYTYNGSRFDLPFIKTKLGINLSKLFKHKDLMFDCWKRNLFGGLKNVERVLRINRELKNVDGKMAVLLWQNYKLYGDKKSLTTLLEYNREDVLNLRVLREKLQV